MRALIRAVTGKDTRSGVLDVPVKACGPKPSEMPASRKGEARRRSEWVKQATPRSRENLLGRAAGARTKTDTGGRVEHTEAIGGTVVKELGTTTP